MSSLTSQQVSSAVESAGLAPISADIAEKLAVYGNLILKWNARTNLTAITDPAVLLQRHLVESVAAAQALPDGVRTLLDYGSGAGLPGIPIALYRGEIAVTLAESQSKKAAFLREAVRSVQLSATVFSDRVANLPAQKRFDLVILRAVDKMELAVPDAASRVGENGWLAIFATDTSVVPVAGLHTRTIKLPTVGHLLLVQSPSVPRGT